ncbi:MAG: SUMF1/EgtB/PvdO family nonheme iron enzyme [Candidatus Lernaella stagnicola]|nr:SUMF1/EgtB/PvdO family nonheme iron enzyme [Candidatus Lernaella stagnicola]
MQAMKAYQSLYYRLTEELRNAKGNAKDLRIVVCIDDLDRCLPERAIELLEGIKVFLDLPGFYFIIGVDERVIRAGILVRYKDFAFDEKSEIPVNPREYLEKIIQIPIRLPPPEISRMLELIRSHAAEDSRLARYCEMIAEVMERKPRACKMAVNLISVNLALAEARKKADASFDYQPDLLAKWTLLQFHAHRELIATAEKWPLLLYHLQEYYSHRQPEQDAAQEPYSLDEWVKNTPGIDDDIIKVILRKDQSEGERLTDFPEDEEAIRTIIEMAAATRIEESPEESKTTRPAKMSVHRLPWKKIPGKDFEMLAYPVTQSLYEEVMGTNPSRIAGEGTEDYPVEMVSWFDSVKFCNTLSKKLGMKEVYAVDEENDTATPIEGAKGIRLPTEEEWVYACLAGGTKDPYGPLEEIAWYGENSEGSTHPVGEKKPNAWDLYDMLGNVWEWCWVLVGKYPTDRVVRGGCWVNSADVVRASVRVGGDPDYRIGDIGFRISRDC